MILLYFLHKYQLTDHIEQKEIGIYSSKENALNAVESLKHKVGFCDTKDGFIVKKVYRVFKPKLLNKTYWVDGFVAYAYDS